MIRAFLYIVGFFIVLAVLGVGIIYFTAPNRYNVMIVGSDQRATEASRSDVLMVFSISKSKEGGINLLTLPRDTRVEVEGHNMQKITHAYGYDKEADAILGNVDLTKQTVENFLDIPIHATVEVTFDSFVDFINSVGGVEVNGKTLDGDEALGIVRDRARPGGDFARTEDQRAILKSLLPLVSTIDGAQETLSFFSGHPEARIQYNKLDLFQFGLAYVLGNRTIHAPTGGIEEYVIPGASDMIYTEEFGKELYYWIPDDAALETMLDEHFR